MIYDEEETRSRGCRTGGTRWFWYVLGAMKLGVVVVHPMARSTLGSPGDHSGGVRGKPLEAHFCTPWASPTGGGS